MHGRIPRLRNQACVYKQPHAKIFQYRIQIRVFGNAEFANQTVFGNAEFANQTGV
jgi:hypothetical protein